MIFSVSCRFDANPAIVSSNPSLHDTPEYLDFNGGNSRGQEQVLSVSGKKKCSHCDEELGKRGFNSLR